MAHPVIALLSDFGTADHYVGAMKGAILSICRHATLVDITHEIPPHDVRAGALQLAAAVPFFPAETTFLAVVDPTVGSGRTALAADAGGFRFVGPDNGVLGIALDGLSVGRMVSLDAPRFARSTISRTFEGRDRFGPAAAWLALGTPLAELGRAVQSYRRLDLPDPVIEHDRTRGEVVFVDRFGNLVTNIRREDVRRPAGRGGPVVRLAGFEAGPIVDTYADVAMGTPCPVFGSSGQLEIAVREGSAAAVFRAGCGDPVDVVWR